ncbi:hypothetical protein [Gloeobacter kilaueensis]|uniref:Uncharacterized protein n=1 Tax=Gloeobacter kilaueensis (strain ATCC BAA-2537 / CCAP 1431/1 / ULC 316 / JS1) TaxID=1183438 RepID=U5QCP6_GLOK1|nr:hypothetical protein [Gloeobacter kilaueensis]AGY56618.1 hypothetical protein GKIL_0371 [Gloeobacter kilaueensis JS1]
MRSASDTPTSSTDETFTWDNDRFEAVVEQHTGAVVGLIDRLICFGLLLFGLASLPGIVMMFWMHLSRSH